MNPTAVSIDTNVLISLFNEEKELNERALAAIEGCRKAGRLVVSGPVYAELLGLPTRTQVALDEFFTRGGIEVDWQFEEAVWRIAGAAFQGYIQRRLASTGQLPRRILTDFLIGAQAIVRGYALLTVDSRLYKASFPELNIRSI
jgi:predicted nucleic acid-binding protein